MAVAGMLEMTLGCRPLQNPLQPYVCHMAVAAFLKVSAFLNDWIWTESLPLTCNTVLMQSKGVVTAAQVAPAIPPQRQWIQALYALVGLKNFVLDS